MTKEQLNTLEDWIVAIIQREDRASDLHEVLYCRRMRDAVEIAFGLKDTTHDPLDDLRAARGLEIVKKEPSQ